MATTQVTRQELLAAYDVWLGQPVRVLELRSERVDELVPTEMDILFFQPAGIEQLSERKQFTYIATAGMSTRTLPGPYERVEMILRVDGPQSFDKLENLGRVLAQLALVPFAESIPFAPNQLLCGIPLPVFEKMNCVLVTHWAVLSEKWLSTSRPLALSLSIIPVFEDEAVVIRDIGDIEASRRFVREGINWNDPLRPRARLEESPEIVGTNKEEEVMSTENVSEAVRQTWADIEEWYRRNIPSLLTQLEKGATDDELGEFEKQLATSLPEDYKTSLQIHNGGSRIHNYSYLSTSESVNSWTLMKNLKAEGKFDDWGPEDDSGEIIQNTWWDLGWIPVAEHEAGTSICVDMAPGKSGVKGQILRVETTDEGPNPTEYKSFLQWLKAYKDDLYNDRYQISEHGDLDRK